jgi:hypothetical protein
MSCGSVLAVTEFRPSYERAAVMQATLALLGALAAMVQWGLGGQLGWLIGELLLGAVVPFTLIVILPTTELPLERLPGSQLAGERGLAETLGSPSCRQKRGESCGVPVFLLVR